MEGSEEDQMESKEGRSLWEVWRRVCMIDERGGGLFRGSRCHHPVSRDCAKDTSFTEAVRKAQVGVAV
jgi:hypothetical protein